MGISDLGLISLLLKFIVGLLLARESISFAIQIIEEIFGMLRIPQLDDVGIATLI